MKENSTPHYPVKSIAIDGLFIALTLTFTFLVNVRLPIAANGGLIHLGNVPLFIGAILFGKRTGALAGAIGMGLFDLLSGWTIWAPFTFVIVGCMGYVIGSITSKRKGMKWVILSLFLAGLIKVAGYYLAERILYGNWIAPLSSIPGNMIQIGVAVVIALPILPVLSEYIGITLTNR